MKMSVESGVYRHGTHGSVYRCPGRTSAGPCPAPARVRGEEIEGLVEHLVTVKVSGDRSLHAARRRVAAAEEAFRRAEWTLERYRDGSGAVTALTPENFARGLAKRQADLEGAAVGLASARRALDATGFPRPDLPDHWSGLSVAQRRRVIDERLDCIFVSAGNGPVTGRAHVCRRGMGPADLPRRGAPIGELRGFDPRSCPGTGRLRRPPRWGPRRIESELRSWREDANEWPTYVEFLVAGRAHLHHQVLAYGGICFWASRLSWTGAPRTTRWTTETIEDGLRPILAGREVWPSAADFRRVGLGGLRRAVIRHGGIQRWADKSGVRTRSGTASSGHSDVSIRGATGSKHAVPGLGVVQA
jgi:hypothetical protein